MALHVSNHNKCHHLRPDKLCRYSRNLQLNTMNHIIKRTCGHVTHPVPLHLSQQFTKNSSYKDFNWFTTIAKDATCNRTLFLVFKQPDVFIQSWEKQQEDMPCFIWPCHRNCHPNFANICTNTTTKHAQYWGLGRYPKLALAAQACSPPSSFRYRNGRLNRYIITLLIYNVSLWRIEVINQPVLHVLCRRQLNVLPTQRDTNDEYISFKHR